ncbi:MAG: Sortase [Sporanaerobacter sp.]|jgi:sortase A|uniref:class A sortase n=1 Tax=Sporanaerobacter sp. TaxID=2010183 RepID=UPI003A0FD945
MKKIISILLILIGTVFLLSPFIKDQIIKYYSNSILEANISPEILKENNENTNLEVKFDFSSVKDIDIKSILKEPRNLNSDFVIGTLYIPDLNINLPIMKGLSQSNLMAGAATMKAEQSFGHGNYTLAGHYMKNKNLLFGNLMNIEIGNKVYVSDGKMIYEYEIYDTTVVPDTAMDMLSDNKANERSKPIISLMTCYHSSKTGKRFFALGELVDEYPVD